MPRSKECPEQFTLWTDLPANGSPDTRPCRGFAPLPKGICGSRCPKCLSDRLIGAIVTETADAPDPNLLCRSCGYWRD
jgi:hypothetical protein